MQNRKRMTRRHQYPADRASGDLHLLLLAGWIAMYGGGVNN